MVAIVTGNGLGLERSSGFVLGSGGSLGSAGFGRYGENVTINAATGNLVINRTDEVLIGTGSDNIVSRSYNSLGQMSDDSHGTWQLNVQRRLEDLPGTPNTAGTTVKLIDWDGSDVLYTYDAGKAAYVSREGVGAYDVLKYSTTTHEWTWTDGDSRVREIFDGSGRIQSSTDLDGNMLLFDYDDIVPTHLETITTTNTATNRHETVTLVWGEPNSADANNILSLTTNYYSDDPTPVLLSQTRVSYTYSNNRLASVTTDLTPENGADSETTVTKYFYDSASGLVNDIRQYSGNTATGARLTFDYTPFNGIYRVTSYTLTAASGITRTTNLAYNMATGVTTITDPDDKVSKLTWYTSGQFVGQLKQVDLNVGGTAAQTLKYTYDTTTGHVATATDGSNNVVTYQYDANGNLTLQRDAAGNTVKRVYDGANNRLLSETRYAGADPDGDGTLTATAGATAYFAYSTETIVGSTEKKSRLMYVVSPLGEVTEYVYDNYGRQTSSIVYRDNIDLAGAEHDVPALNADPAQWASQLATWRSGLDRSTIRRVDRTYDFRGNLLTVKDYAAAAATTGAGQSPVTTATYLYDQHGNLLSRLTSGISGGEVFTYDGLGRLTSSTNLATGTTEIDFDDGANKSIVTLANGLIRTSTYNYAGELISFVETRADTPPPTSPAVTTTYKYDSLGRQRIAIDPLTHKTYWLYDAIGRKVADIAHDGTLVEYVYDKSNRLVETTHYENKVNTALLVETNGDPVEGLTLASVGVRPAASTTKDQIEWRIYDQADRLVQTIDGTGSVTTYEYDGQSRLVRTRNYVDQLTATTIAAFRTTPPGALNRIYNSEFSSTILDGQGDGWSIFGAQIGSFSSGVTSGKSYLKNTFTATGPGQVTSISTDNLHWATVTGGERLAIQAGVEATGAVGVLYLNALMRRADGSSVVITVATLNGTQDFNAKMSGFIDVPADMVDLRLELYMSSASAASGTFSLIQPMVTGAGDAQTAMPPFGAVPTAAPDDVVTRSFYDGDGRLIGTLDGAGYLTEIRYNGAGEKIETIAYADITAPLYRADETFDRLLLTVEPDPDNDQHVRYFYDGRGLLRYVVDATRHPVEYAYDTAGHVLHSYDYAGTIPNPTGAWSLTYVKDQIALVDPATNKSLANHLDTRKSFSVYDVATGQLAYAIDGAGVVTGYSYDAFGRVTKQVQYATLKPTTADPAEDTMNTWVSDHTVTGDRVTRMAYDQAGRLRFLVDPEKYVTEYRYVRSDMKTDEVRYEARHTGNVYDYDSLAAIYVTDVPASAVQTHYTYDPVGRVATMVEAYTAAETTTTAYGYDGQGRVKDVTVAYGTPDASTTRMTYDLAGRMASVINALDAPEETTTTYAYDGFGRVTDQTTASGTANSSITHTDYDAAGRVEAVTRAFGAAEAMTTAYVYDPFDRVKEEVTASGTADARTTHYDYDVNDRVTSVIRGYGTADAATTGYSYDAFGDVLTTTDPRTNITYSFYDKLGRLKLQVDAEGYATKTTYTLGGSIASVIRYVNPVTAAITPGVAPTVTANATRDTTTTYAYDKLERLTRVTDTLANYEEYTLDAFGNRRFVRNKLGGMTENGFDELGNLESSTETITTVDTTTTIETSYSYDKRGNRTQMIEADVVTGGVATTQRTTDYDYDLLDRLVKSTDELSHSTEFTYDDRNNLVATKDALGKITRYVYDKADRRVATIDALGGVVYTRYDGGGRVISTTAFANPTTLTGSTPLEITAATLTLPTASSTGDQITRYAYDGKGQLRFSVDALMHLTEYVTDKAGNVVRTTAYDGTVTATTGDYTTDYLAGRATALRLLPGTRYSRAVYDATNRLTFSIDALKRVTAYVYDSKGQTIRQMVYAALYTDTDNPTDADMQDWAADPDNIVDARTTRAIYDAMGRLVYSVDALKAVTEYRYDKLGNVKEQVAYLDPETIVDTDTPATVATKIGTQPTTARVTKFIYDSAGRLIETVDPEAVRTVMTLDGLGHATSTTIAYGTTDASTTIRSYDALGRVESETRAPGLAEASTTDFTYDALGRKETSTTGGVKTRWEYDALGQVKKQILGFGLGPSETTERSFEYDAFGRVKTETDGLGHTTVRTYDKLDRVLSISVQVDSTAGNNLETRYDYGIFGNIRTTREIGAIDAVGFTYLDKLGRVWLEIDAELYLTKTTYDSFGNVATVTRYENPLASVPTLDMLDSPPYVGNPGAADATTSFLYDERDRLERSTDAETKYEEYGYNLFGDRIWSRNRLSGQDLNPVKQTNYTYDKRGRLLSETLPIETKEADGDIIAVKNSYSYDKRGNRKTMIEAVGAAEQRTTEYGYDKLDRLTTTETKFTGTYIVFGDEWATANTGGTALTSVLVERNTYDARGNVIRVLDAADTPTEYRYDALDRKIAELRAMTKTGSSPDVFTGTLTTWTYDANGNVKTQRIHDVAVQLPATAGGAFSTPSAYRETRFDYDFANRMTATTLVGAGQGVEVGVWSGSSYAVTTANLITSFVYDKLGNVVKQTDAKDNASYTWYDRLGRRIGQRDAEKYATLWTLDGDGNVESETRFATQLTANPIETTSYATLLTYIATDTAKDRTTTFEYDKNGRRTRETRLGVTATVINAGNGDRTETTGPAAIQYVYNGLGQVTQKIEANGDTTDYAYDAVGRLTREIGASFEDFDEGPDVRRATSYAYNGINNLTRTVTGADGVTSADDRVTEYTYDKIGRLLTEKDATLFVRSYAYDKVGRVVREGYSRRTPAATVYEAIGYRYDAGGRLIAQAMGTRPAANGTFAYGGAGLGVTWMRYNSFGEMTDRGMTALTSESPAYPVDNGRYQERFDYDAGGRLWRTRTGDGIVRILFYDKTGNQTLSLVSSSVNLLATAQVDAGNGITTAGTSGIDDSITTITLYDKRGMQTGTVEPLRKHSSAAAANITRTRLYNAFGEVRSETDGRNNATTFEYNMLGRLTKKTSPQVSVTGETSMTATDVNPVETYAYDISGRLVGVQDANGNWTTRTLLAGTGHEGGATGGSGALVVKEFQPDESPPVAGGVVENKYFTNKYDVFGDLRVTVDEVNKTIQYGYDKMGRLVKLTHAVRPANTAGNPTTDAVQLIDLYAYDGLGQRIFAWNSQYFPNDLDPTDVPSSTNLSKTTYDAAGRVVAMMTMGNQLTNYAYVWDGAASVAGSGVMGGWQKTTTNALSLTMQETTDYFGHDTGGSDFGLHVHAYSYDRLYRLTARTTTTHGASESIAYTWFNTGQVAGQTGSKGIATYEYDKDGRRTKESFTKGATMYRSATATYDAAGRMKTWTDFGSTGNTLPDASIVWSYDAQGNVRRTVATYQSLDSQGNPVSATPQDYWYRYDKMNRVITSQGIFDTATNTIKRGTGEGRDIAYDKAGQRTSMIYSKAENDTDEYGEHSSVTHTRETYVYSADGYLAQVRTATATYDATYGGSGDGGAPTGSGNVTASYVRDAMGRTTAYDEGPGYEQTTDYNAASQITRQITTTVRDATYVATVNNIYDAVGNVTSSTNHTAKLGFNDGPPDNKTTYTYEWWDGALQDTIVYDRDTGDYSNTPWDTDLDYDGSGHITTSDIDDDRDRTVTFVTDANGMIVNRREADNLAPPSNDPQANGDPRDIRYFFNGRQLGHVTNNGTDNTDYAFSVQQHRETPGYGAFAGGATRGTPYAAFAENYDAINGFDSNNRAFRYTVHTGDTLTSIAMTLWGDASLWYMIAEANGLMGDETLVEGQSIIIPDKVHNFHNNASTFTPYDPNAAIGDNAPTDPKIPKKKGCGVIGMILLAVVAVAVAAIAGPAIIGSAAVFGAGGTVTTVATGLTAVLGGTAAAAGSAAAIGAAVIGGALAGAAGSIVSQGLGVATGLQDKFSWKAVGLAAIGGGVGGGLQGVNAFGASGLGKLTNFANDFARGALSSSLTQSIGVVTGLQKKLDWAGIAAAGVGSAVGGAINRGLADGGLGVRGDRVGAFTHKDVAFYANGALSGMAGAITNAATRSAISGTNFGDNIMAALPEVIGATIGNLIGDKINAEIHAQNANKTGSAGTDETEESGGATLASQPDNGVVLIPPQQREVIDALGLTVEFGPGGLKVIGYDRKSIPSVTADGKVLHSGSDGVIAPKTTGGYAFVDTKLAEWQGGVDLESGGVNYGYNYYFKDPLSTGFTVDWAGFDGEGAVRFLSNPAGETYLLVDGGQSIPALGVNIKFGTIDAGPHTIISDYGRAAENGRAISLSASANLEDSSDRANLRGIVDTYYATQHMNPQGERGEGANASAMLTLDIADRLRSGESWSDAIKHAGTPALQGAVDRRAHRVMNGPQSGPSAAGGARNTLVGEIGPLVRKPTARATSGVDPMMPTADRGSRVPVKLYDVGTYAELSARSAIGDDIAIDHQPSNASNLVRWETMLGRKLTEQERILVRNQGTAVAVPQSWHLQESSTYGGRNSPARVKADAANPVAAAIRDSQAMINGASPIYRDAAAVAAAKIRARANGQ